MGQRRTLGLFGRARLVPATCRPDKSSCQLPKPKRAKWSHEKCREHSFGMAADAAVNAIVASRASNLRLAFPLPVVAVYLDDFVSCALCFSAPDCSSFCLLSLVFTSIKINSHDPAAGVQPRQPGRPGQHCFMLLASAPPRYFVDAILFIYL